MFDMYLAPLRRTFEPSGTLVKPGTFWVRHLGNLNLSVEPLWHLEPSWNLEPLSYVESWGWWTFMWNLCDSLEPFGCGTIMWKAGTFEVWNFNVEPWGIWHPQITPKLIDKTPRSSSCSEKKKKKKPIQTKQGKDPSKQSADQPMKQGGKTGHLHSGRTCSFILAWAWQQAHKWSRNLEDIGDKFVFL